MRVFRLPRLLVVVAVAALGAGCRREAAPPEAPPASATWRFGVVVPTHAAEVRETYAPLLAALAASVGRPVELRVAPDYQTLESDLLTGRVHLAQVSAYLYATIAVARARSGLAVQLIAQERRAAATRYAGVFVVKPEHPANTLAELRGQRVAWVDASSSSGYHYPRLRLAALGLGPDGFFSAEQLAGSHEAVLAAVKSGAADVGAVSEQSATLSGLRILDRTEPIPDDAIISLDELDAADRGAVQRFFLGAHQNPTLANFFIARGLERYGLAEIAVYEAQRDELERRTPAGPPPPAAP
jgi:phosphate/phosphite/phosphonate ABC transporter binding protein